MIINSGTFDVQNLLVSECPGGGGICVSIEYVEGTLTHQPRQQQRESMRTLSQYEDVLPQGKASRANYVNTN